MTPPRAPLMPLDDALARLLAQALPLPGVDTMRTFDADGRVLAHDLVSALQVPPLDNSAMDGYALRCADVPQPGTVLPVSQRIPAGRVGTPLQPGTAARILPAPRCPRGPMPWSWRKNAAPRAMAMCACRPRPARARTSASRGKTSPAAPWCCRPVRA